MKPQFPFAGVFCALLLACGPTPQSFESQSDGIALGEAAVTSPIKWLAPSGSTSSANQTIVLSVRISGAAPDSISFWSGTTQLDVLKGSSAKIYSTTVDASALAEGTSQTFTAQMTRAGQTVTSAVRTVKIDRTVPLIKEPPYSGWAVIDPTDQLPLVFTKRMSPASFAKVSVTDATGAAVAHTFSPSPDGTVWWFQLVAPTKSPLTVHVKVDQTLADEAGNTLPASQAFDWALRFSAWAALPLTASPSLLHYASTVELQLNSDGQHYLAWSAYDPATTRQRVQVAHFDGESVTPVGGLLSLEPTNDAVLPVLSENEHGELLVAFRDSNRIVVVEWSGGQWQPVGAPLSEGTAVTGGARLFGRRGRQPIITFTQGAHWFVRQWSGTQWAPMGEMPPVIDPSWSTFTTPVLADDGAGHIALSWNEIVGFHEYPRIALFSGGSWVLTSTVGLPDRVAQIAYTTDGTLVLGGTAFSSKDHSEHLILMSYDGSAWSKVRGGDISLGYVSVTSLLALPTGGVAAAASAFNGDGYSARVFILGQPGVVDITATLNSGRSAGVPLLGVTAKNTLMISVPTVDSFNNAVKRFDVFERSY